MRNKTKKQSKMQVPKEVRPFIIDLPQSKFDKEKKVWIKIFQKYLNVAGRVLWFRLEHPDWTIKTKLIKLSDKNAIFRAQIIDKEGKMISIATKQENIQNFKDFIEKAETGAIGRALALAGYGTQFTGELDEGLRLADAPVKVAKETPVTGKKKEEKIDINKIDF